MVFSKNQEKKRKGKAKFTENVVFPRHLSQWRIFQCFLFTVFKTIGIKNYWVVKFKFNHGIEKKSMILYDVQFILNDNMKTLLCKRELRFILSSFILLFSFPFACGITINITFEGLT